MAIAADSAGVADAIEPSPSGVSLHGLDAVNLFLAGALSGFGPYVAAFLAEQNWAQQDIGFALTAAGFAGLLSQLPGGALLDEILSRPGPAILDEPTSKRLLSAYGIRSPHPWPRGYQTLVEILGGGIPPRPP